MFLGHGSDNEPISMDMLEDIHDNSQYHNSVNRGESPHKIHYHNKQSQVEWKRA